MRRYRSANRETIRAWNRSPEQRAKARKRKTTPAYRAWNNGYTKKWRKKNRGRWKDICSATRHKRRASVRSTGSFTPSEWQELKRKYGHRCLGCGKKRKLTPDHVVPLSKGGSGRIGNIQPLCEPCNKRKGTKRTDYRRKTYGR